MDGLHSDGRQWRFRVVDNGVGKDAPPDHVNFIQTSLEPDFALDWCATREGGLALRDIEKGDIQIRPLP